MISARMSACEHCGLRPFEQLRSASRPRSAWAAPMLTVSETRSPHQRKSAVRASPASTCACAASEFAGALVRNDQKFVVAPAAQFLGRPQPLRQGAFDSFKHRFAGSRAVRLAQFVRLVDGDPQQAERCAPSVKSSNADSSLFFNLCLAASRLDSVTASPCGNVSRLSAG